MGNLQVEHELGSKLVLPNSDQYEERRQILIQ